MKSVEFSKSLFNQFKRSKFKVATNGIGWK